MAGWVDRYDAAFAVVRHAVALDPDHFQGHVHDRTGQADAALESYRTAHRVSGANPLLLGFQGSVVGRTGGTDDARQLVATLEQIARAAIPCRRASSR
jgi:cytochrome c-type biogenesis protein CcmH/NrfG